MTYQWKIIGFERLKKNFEEMFGGEKGASSFLFYGQEMIGKKTFALELAHHALEVLDTTFIKQELMFIDSSQSESKESIGIEEVRGIKQFLSLSPLSGEYKFVIIDDAHKMQEPAQNALLKIIEEPPSFAKIILISHKPGIILPTITSRCQMTYFPTHGVNIIKKTVADLKPGLSEDQVNFLADFSNGRIGLVMDAINKDALKDIKSAVEKFYKLEKEIIAIRLEFANKMSGPEKLGKLNELILYWLLYLRQKSLSSPKIVKTIRNLLDLEYSLSHPQYNHKLAIANFLINL